MSTDRDEDYEAFFTAQFPAVARTAALIAGDTQDGMDIAQEAMARVYQHWRKVSQMEHPAAWAHKVASNLAVSHRRRSYPRISDFTEVAVPPAEAPDEELLRALRELPPSQRGAIVLRFYLDWSVEQTADALGKRPGTITALTHQGMEHLRATLAKEPR